MKCVTDVQHLRQMSLLPFEVKVKVQGQNRRTEDLPLAIARLWFKISSPNLAIRQNTFGTKYMPFDNMAWFELSECLF